MSDFPAGICNQKWRAIPRQADGDREYIHFTGGFRAGRISDNAWMIEPVFEAGEARTKGFLTKAQLQKLTASQFRVLGFQSSGWSNGVWHSSWRPIIPGESNHYRSPAEIWSSISRNLFSDERAKKLEELKTPDQSIIASILDTKTIEERLAQSISLSFRSMDVAVEQIAEYYHEQLVNDMYAGRLNGQRVSRITDQNLFANVHSFFLQFGAARDYLAAFIANRLGYDASRRKVDTLDALVKKLRSAQTGRDAILDLLINKQWLVQKNDKPDEWESAGWLKQISELRNDIVHGRPYGSAFSERCGWSIALSSELGLYRYFRPIEIKDQSDLRHFGRNLCPLSDRREILF